MSEAFAQGAAYIANSIATENTAANFFVYIAALAAEEYLYQRAIASLAPDKPKGEGRGLEVAITDTGATGFAIYGTLRVGGTNIIPK